MKQSMMLQRLADRYFGLTTHSTTVRTEIVAGVVTFMTMGY